MAVVIWSQNNRNRSQLVTRTAASYSVRKEDLPSVFVTKLVRKSEQHNLSTHLIVEPENRVRRRDHGLSLTAKFPEIMRFFDELCGTVKLLIQIARR